MSTLFKLSPPKSFQWPVQITLPGGGQGEITFDFFHKTKEALSVWMSSATGRSDVDVLSEVILGWSGVSDESGALVNYSPEALQTIISNYPKASREIYLGYLAAWSGAREKN